MHYHHAYHAGNFADVFKHVLLCALLGTLRRKDKPWCFLDTHAGAGLYDLNSAAAGKTAESLDGIARLRDANDAPELIQTYLKLALGRGRQRYPGSPLFAEALLSPGSRLVLCERVPEVCAMLKSCISAEVHCRDGYEAHALLPPREKRGLVLVDPPFEARDELDRIREFLAKALARFSNGIYAVWYPRKNTHETQRFIRACQRECVTAGLVIEFDNGAPGEGQMRACGLLILNPPFALAQEVEPAMRYLVQKLAQGPRARYDIQSWDKP